MTRRDLLQDAVVAITGGTGSFGSTMANHLLHCGVSEIRIFSRDEAKQDAMRNQIADSRMHFYIGDTRDYDSVDKVVKGSDLVFHAAALKQVPSAEFFPMEAVKTNINGSVNVLNSAVKRNVKSVVCLSTDKAVYPINAMGMSKALMEKSAQALARENPDAETRISVTRYGNVMYSRGSVIPMFISQIRSGEPVRVTDPNMTRFLMSLSQSVDLVKYAFENAQTGDLFVRKAPACTIGTLAQALCELFDVESRGSESIGFRHGEKLFESLISVEEMSRAEDLGDYYRVPLDSRGLDYSDYFDFGQGRKVDLDAYTSHNTDRLTIDSVKELLLTIPEIRQELGL